MFIDFSVFMNSWYLPSILTRYAQKVGAPHLLHFAIHVLMVWPEVEQFPKL